ncbi:EF-hand domain-containing protein [Azoarcus sp. DN11]|uniref:EF-hand domain-containing protein n=1 Tax=Azoarcus sp. DN11 TaxID=356837 RepID=UPI000EB4EC47|nr:EF-hand domain-containing protein [Azoarcus sp. DN11]AYH43036.1 hypothetical protein CDA09_06480 [Azoarcus sp. DN11]
MKNILTVLALAAAGTLPVAAAAADPAKPPVTPDSAPAALKGVTPQAGRTELPPMFKELDQDKDGQISKDEAKRSAEVLSNFDAIDTDHNGKISLIEWNAHEKAKRLSQQSARPGGLPE